MVRPLRIKYPGALYHVTSRGNAYQDIFLNDKDRRAFLNNLKYCIKLHNLICHAYCLMNNHYHLLIETPDGNLSQAMRDINGNYTQGFNARHKCVGHVMQGRYKAFLVEKEPYLLEVVRYIVNNPVEAKMVEHPKNWKWSSFCATAGFVKSPAWLMTDFTLSLFSKKRNEAQKQYQDFVKEGMERGSPYDDVKEGVILGSPQFIGWVWENFKELELVTEVKTSNRMIGRPSLEDLFYDITKKKQRDNAMRVARVRAGYSVTEIANHLGLHRTTVSRILNSSL
ncbi:MAG: transposase [Candidatus Uhrbacteria bacterium]|nr:transposase [Candidatus Uhrbacteria bacterium]